MTGFLPSSSSKILADLGYISTAVTPIERNRQRSLHSSFLLCLERGPAPRLPALHQTSKSSFLESSPRIPVPASPFQTGLRLRCSARNVFLWCSFLFPVFSLFRVSHSSSEKPNDFAANRSCPSAPLWARSRSCRPFLLCFSASLASCPASGARRVPVAQRSILWFASLSFPFFSLSFCQPTFSKRQHEQVDSQAAAETSQLHVRGSLSSVHFAFSNALLI